jgi:ABC-type Fe3+-siderophore transport system permease subunit
MTVMAYFLGSSLDFRFSTPVRIKKTTERKVPVLGILSLLAVAATIITDVVLIFSKLQNADTGKWYLGGLKDVNWTAVIIVTAVGLILAAVLMLIDKEKCEKDSEFKA